jgi:hypothetical protein
MAQCTETDCEQLLGIPFGFGMVVIYFAANAYLIDAFPDYVASALAAKTVVRSGMGAAMPLFIVPVSERHQPTLRELSVLMCRGLNRCTTISPTVVRHRFSRVSPSSW